MIFSYKEFLEKHLAKIKSIRRLMSRFREKSKKVLIIENCGPIWAKTFYFQKSKNVTFLDILKANLMQKTNGGEYEKFCHRQTHTHTLTEQLVS